MAGNSMKLDCLTQIFEHNNDIPMIMGIINLDHNSFYKPSIVNSVDEVLSKTQKLINDGMNILDIGAFTSRPGSVIPPQEIEQKRLIPVVNEICNAFPELVVSMDTVYAKTAEEGILAGVEIINDISGGSLDPDLPTVVARNRKILVLMHMRGTPENMMDTPNLSYKNVTSDLIYDFKKKIDHYATIHLDRIIIDPGFGFSKSLSDNYNLLTQLSLFKILDLPIMAGLSRKSMIWKVLNSTPDKVLAGSIAAALIAAQNGASILRVHDVLETHQMLQVLHQCKHLIQN